ncbi:MAG TPA: hypothetical protein PKL83_06825, partial [bacterium]|nr:hypothetical protein [bacterium]
IILLRRLNGRVTIRLQNLFCVDHSQASVILCFLNPTALAKLTPVFQKTLKPGTKVVSYLFPLPGLTPSTEDRPDTNHLPIYLYTF